MDKRRNRLTKSLFSHMEKSELYSTKTHPDLAYIRSYKFSSNLNKDDALDAFLLSLGEDDKSRFTIKRVRKTGEDDIILPRYEVLEYHYNNPINTKEANEESDDK